MSLYSEIADALHSLGERIEAFFSGSGSWLEHVSGQGVMDQERINFTGEPVKRSELDRWLDSIPDDVLFFEYGDLEEDT